MHGQVTPDEANEWLHKHFADDPDASIEIVPAVSEIPNPAAYAQLLNLLFAPRTDS